MSTTASNEKFNVLCQPVIFEDMVFKKLLGYKLHASARLFVYTTHDWAGGHHEADCLVAWCILIDKGCSNVCILRGLLSRTDKAGALPRAWGRGSLIWSQMEDSLPWTLRGGLFPSALGGGLLPWAWRGVSLPWTFGFSLLLTPKTIAHFFLVHGDVIFIYLIILENWR